MLAVVWVCIPLSLDPSNRSETARQNGYLFIFVHCLYQIVSHIILVVSSGASLPLPSRATLCALGFLNMLMTSICDALVILYSPHNLRYYVVPVISCVSHCPFVLCMCKLVFSMSSEQDEQMQAEEHRLKDLRDSSMQYSQQPAAGSSRIVAKYKPSILAEEENDTEHHTEDNHTDERNNSLTEAPTRSLQPSAVEIAVPDVPVRNFKRIFSIWLVMSASVFATYLTCIYVLFAFKVLGVGTGLSTFMASVFPLFLLPLRIVMVAAARRLDL